MKSNGVLFNEMELRKHSNWSLVNHSFVDIIESA